MITGIQIGALSYAPKIQRFLRELIAIPSTSCQEGAVVARIQMEMEALAYDEIKIDGMGNILGRMGCGPRVIAFDGHIDTVGVGRRDNWNFDPFIGKEDDDYIYGRGASDQTGGFCSAVYGAKLMKDFGLLEDFTVWVVGSVQEEDCDGLCWQYILDQRVLDPPPEFVVITEPTDLNVYRGQRGRMEIKVSVPGISAHGSAPERGDNAIYKMAKILNELEALNLNLKDDPFLGKGTLVVSEIFYTSPSRCAVADGCSISIDRRLTVGETMDSAISEIQALPSVQKYAAVVEMYRYHSQSYTGYKPDVPCHFPTWVIPETHPICGAMVSAHQALHGAKPLLDKWTFSTNGVAIMGMNRIPCIGYGPGREEEAHAPNEKISKASLLKAMATYAYLLTQL